MALVLVEEVMFPIFLLVSRRMTINFIRLGDLVADIRTLSFEYDTADEKIFYGSCSYDTGSFKAA